MLRKRVTLFGSALREIGAAATSLANFVTAVPLTIRDSGDGLEEVEASGVKLLLQVTSRVTQDATALALNVWLEHQDLAGNWLGLAGSTMTPVVTATAFETLEIYPGGDVTTTPPRASFYLPHPLRANAQLHGSTTATPGMTFQLDAELFS